MTIAYKTVPRRSFLKTAGAAAAAGGVIGSPHLIPSGVLAAPGRMGANDKLTFGHIGVGGMGGYHLRDIKGRMQRGETHIAAVCDVDEKRLENASRTAGPQADVYRDYRYLIQRKDIDAVVIATPDHWHALPAIHACQAGKDVYVEKPLSWTIREGRLMVEAVRNYKRVLQTGSQRRSMKNHRIGCELVRNGRAGKIHTVIANNYPSPWRCALPGQPVPEGLDWDAWCGPTEPVPYHKDIYIQRSNPGWISLLPWSGGEMTGNGPHGFDQIQWALDMDQTGPVEVGAEGGKLEAPIYTAPESRARGDRLCSQGRAVTFRYGNGVTVKTGAGSACGAIFIGDEGRIMIGCDSYSSDPPEIAKEPIGDSELHLPVSDNHLRNWFDAIRSRERPIADVEIGHRSVILCHLGNIARWVGRKLRWDPETESFPDDEEANGLLDRPRRKGYELPDPV